MKEDIEMMGQQKGVQDQLFYCFNLDRYVPSDHLLRGIDQPRVYDVYGNASVQTAELFGIAGGMSLF
jgi:hypothetical protein